MEDREAVKDEKNNGTISKVKEIIIKDENRPVVIAFGLLVAVIIIAVAVSLANAAGKPEKVARAFMNALVRGDYGRAYDMLDIQDTGSLFSQQAFASYINQKYGKIRSYRIDYQKEYNEMQSRVSGLISPEEARNYSLENHREYTAFVDGIGNRGELPLILENTSVSSRPRWKIDPEPFVQEARIQSVPGAVVQVNGVEYPVGNEGTLELKGFLPQTVTVALQGAEPVVADVWQSNFIKVEKFKPTDEVRQQVVKVVENFNRTWAEAVQSGNPELVKPYVAEDYPLPEGWFIISGPRNVLESTREYIRELQEDQLSAVVELEDITIHDVYFSPDKPGEVMVEDSETWHRITKDPNGKVQDDTVQQVKWRYCLVKEGGTWKIAYDEAL